MKVKELIERLQKEPENADVKIGTCFREEDVIDIMTHYYSFGNRHEITVVLEYKLHCEGERK
jgi:hypothetical protein